MRTDGEASATPTRLPAARPRRRKLEEKKEDKKEVRLAVHLLRQPTPRHISASRTSGGGRRNPILAAGSQDRSRAQRESFSDFWTGLGGRITKQDITSFIERQSSAPATSVLRQFNSTASPSAQARPAAPSAPAPYPGDLVPMTNMRKIIAQAHDRVAPHPVPTCIACTRWTSAESSACATNKKPASSSATVSVSRSCRSSCGPPSSHYKQWPIVNASLEGDNVHYHRNINVGIAVALDWGLIVPVLKNAG